jgi:hypothetical protein
MIDRVKGFQYVDSAHSRATTWFDVVEAYCHACRNRQKSSSKRMAGCEAALCVTLRKSRGDEKQQRMLEDLGSRVKRWDG